MKKLLFMLLAFTFVLSVTASTVSTCEIKKSKSEVLSVSTSQLIALDFDKVYNSNIDLGLEKDYISLLEESRNTNTFLPKTFIENNSYFIKNNRIYKTDVIKYNWQTHSIACNYNGKENFNNILQNIPGGEPLVNIIGNSTNHNFYPS